MEIDWEAMRQYELKNFKLTISKKKDGFCWGKHIVINFSTNGWQFQTIAINNDREFSALVDALGKITSSDFDY